MFTSAHPSLKRTLIKLEHVQRRTVKKVKELKTKSLEEQLKDLGSCLVCRREVEKKCDSCLQISEGLIVQGLDLFSVVPEDKTITNRMKLSGCRYRLDIRKTSWE